MFKEYAIDSLQLTETLGLEDLETVWTPLQTEHT